MRAFLVVVFVFGSAASTEAKPITRKPVEVPVVAGAGYDALDVNRLSLVATPQSLVIDGQTVPFDHRDDLVSPQVKRVLEQRLHVTGRAKSLTLFLDRTTPYRSLIELAVSAREAGVEELFFATQTSSGAVEAPLVLRTAAELDAVPGVMVSVLERQILIWSRSGLEGTLAKPKRSIAFDHPHALQQLTATLDDIVQRWWLPRDLRTVSLQADESVPVQTIAHVLGALRQTADGRVLFSSVALAG